MRWTMRRGNAAADYAKWVQRGRGQGEGSDYVSWLGIRDVPSQAMRSRLVSSRFGRVFNFFSNGELITFLILEWDENVLQVKDQYPLDPAVTQELAKTLDIRHPAVCGEDIVMTTDFVVDYAADGRRITKAIQVKHSAEEAAKTRTQEKLKLEKLYWESKGIDYELVYAADYPNVLASNLRQLFRWRNQVVSKRDLDTLGRGLAKVFRTGFISAQKLCEPRIEMPDARRVISPDEAFKTLIAHKRIPFDINTTRLQDAELAAFGLA